MAVEQDDRRGSITSEYNTSDLIEPPDVEFLHSYSTCLDSITQRRISDRLIRYALSNNYLILGSSEMNSVAWQVYRLNKAYSPVRNSSKSPRAFNSININNNNNNNNNNNINSKPHLLATHSGSKVGANKNQSRARSGAATATATATAGGGASVGSVASHTQSNRSGENGGSIGLQQPKSSSVGKNNCAKSQHETSRKCVKTCRQMMLSASTCTLRSAVRTLTKRRLKHVRHRTLLTSYLHTSTHTDNICICQLQCLLLRSDSWDFNVFHLDQYSLGRPVLHLALHLFNKHDLIREFHLDYRALIETLKIIEDSYHPNITYHNSVHAADVAQAVDCLMRDTALFQHMTPFDKMMLLLSAFTHDVDHPGVNAPFLLKTNHFLAKLSAHSCSILENHHWRTAAAIISSTGLFKHFSPEMHAKTLERLRQLILATDIVRHQEYITQFTEYLDQRRHVHMNVNGPTETDKEFLMQYIIKLADVCNPTRSWELCQHWSSRICIEFFRQGDLERQLGLPVTPRFDRNTTTVADTQIGFIDYVVRHCFVLWNRYTSSDLSDTLLDNLESNRRTWEIAKTKQQKALADENESQSNREREREATRENYGNRQAKPLVEICLVADSETNESAAESSDENKQQSPIKGKRKWYVGMKCDCASGKSDGKIAAYLNDRRHSMPNDAVIDGSDGSVIKKLEVAIGGSEQRRSSMPHVLALHMNGIGKRLPETLQNAMDASESKRTNAQRWPPCEQEDSNSDDDAVDENRPDDAQFKTKTSAIPVIKIDEVLITSAQQSDACVEADDAVSAALESPVREKRRPNRRFVRNKLSLQFPAMAIKKQSVIEGPTNLADLLRHRRYSFPPSSNELSRIDVGNFVKLNFEERNLRTERSRRVSNPNAGIRRVKTIAKADVPKFSLPPADESAEERLPAESEIDSGENATEANFTSPSSQRRNNFKLLQIDDDEDDDKLCLPHSQRHRSHSIEFDSARFVGGTMQYLASIGYDIIVAASNSNCGSPCN